MAKNAVDFSNNCDAIDQLGASNRGLPLALLSAHFGDEAPNMWVDEALKTSTRMMASLNILVEAHAKSVADAAQTGSHTMTSRERAQAVARLHQSAKALLLATNKVGEQTRHDMATRGRALRYEHDDSLFTMESVSVQRQGGSLQNVADGHAMARSTGAVLAQNSRSFAEWLDENRHFAEHQAPAIAAQRRAILDGFLDLMKQPDMLHQDTWQTVLDFACHPDHPDREVAAKVLTGLPFLLMQVEKESVTPEEVQAFVLALAKHAHGERGVRFVNDGDDPAMRWGAYVATLLQGTLDRYAIEPSDQLEAAIHMVRGMDDGLQRGL